MKQIDLFNIEIETEATMIDFNYIDNLSKEEKPKRKTKASTDDTDITTNAINKANSRKTIKKVETKSLKEIRAMEETKVIENKVKDVPVKTKKHKIKDINIKEFKKQIIEDIKTPDIYIKHMENISEFYKYSYTNVMLIKFQLPTATKVATYKEWDKRGRYIKRGEKGIDILIPTPYKVRDKDGQTITDENGNDETRMFFKTGSVFDISQTVLKEGYKDEKDDRPELRKVINKFKDKFNVSINVALKPADYYGSAILEDRHIDIDSSIKESEQYIVLIHELAHILLEHKGYQSAKDQALKEIEAETVTYIVNNNIKILKNDDHIKAYIQSYYNQLKDIMNNEILEDILKRTQKVAKEILTTIYEI